MSNIIKQSEDLVTYVKNVIFKYCSYVDDRISILGDVNSSQIDIEITISNNESQISFLFGNGSFKQGIPEQKIIPYVIEFQEIRKIIDFILKDHEVIGDIDFYNNELNLKFVINWTDESIKGINCGDIGLRLSFNNDIELEKQYLYLLFQNYYNYLEHIPSLKKTKNEYINNVKQSYFSTLDKTQLISLLNRMNENELKELLYNLDNDLFMKYTTDSKQQTKVKELLLEMPNKKD